MAKLQRRTQKVFASQANADQIAVFGSMKTGTPDYSSDVEELQSTEYLQGWSDAILGDKAPYLEEMNGVQYGLSYQTAYMLQEGIPEYDANTNYSNTTVLKAVDANNNIILYHSLKADNLGNPLSDATSWQRLYITTVGYIGQPQFTLNFGENVLPDDCIWLEGQALSRTLYAQLFAVYGTTYGEGDGETTFNVPDFRNRVLWGGETAGYISAGLPNITGNIMYGDDRDSAYQCRLWTADGAFAATGAYRYTGNFDGGSSGTWASNANFNASRSSSIYGNSTTVQPPAIKCRVFTRYQ